MPADIRNIAPGRIMAPQKQIPMRMVMYRKRLSSFRKIIDNDAQSEFSTAVALLRSISFFDVQTLALSKIARIMYLLPQPAILLIRECETVAFGMGIAETINIPI
jgi:hypothetical protein